MFLVSLFVLLHWINLYRFNLDPTMLTPGSMDLTGTYRGVSLWLCSSGTFQVSGFDFLCIFVVDTLDLEPYRFDLVSSMSMPGSNDPTGTFRNVPMWLRSAGAFGVSIFIFWRLTDVSRLDFDSTTSPSMSNESVRTFQSVCGWLRHVDTYLVSHFDFWRLADFCR